MVAPVSFWTGKRVLLTGHTGFKGAWLALWLTHLGARVTGLALAPETEPALFDQLGLASEMDHRLGDIRDSERVASVVRYVRPDIVLHLAAQALVLRGYREPIETFATNVMGTAHVLDALRSLDKPCAAVIVTTDKVYRNIEWEFGYRETDHLGGHDPYSASKAAAEIAIDSWRKSFLCGASPIRIASARAGNVIGGGDWSENRIVPDLVRALAAGREIEVRNPGAIRPWQHVLEPLGGYLLLAEKLYASPAPELQDAFNFGPTSEAERTVRELVEQALKHWPGTWRDTSKPGALHEAGRLALNIDRASARLGWAPAWDFKRAIAETVSWYRESASESPQQLRARTLRAIDGYQASRGKGAIS
jgi:CDP-glucose 4,6-dehydratase